MLLAGRIGGAGLCGGRGRVFTGTPAREARIRLAGMTGIAATAARRRRNAAASLSIII